MQTLQNFTTNKTTTLSKQMVSFLGLLCMYSSNGNEIILANGKMRSNLLKIARSLIVLLDSTTEREAVAFSLRLVFYLLMEGFLASRPVGHRHANEYDLLAETLTLLKKSELFNSIFQWRALGTLSTLQNDDEQIKRSLTFIVKQVKETADIFGRSGSGSQSLLVSGMGISDLDATNDTNSTMVAAKLQSLRQVLQDSRASENLPLQCLDAIFAAASSPSCQVARRACALIHDSVQRSHEGALIAVILHLASDSVAADSRCCSYLLRTIQTIISTSSSSQSATSEAEIETAGDDGTMNEQSCILSDEAAVDLYRSTVSLLKHPR